MVELSRRHSLAIPFLGAGAAGPAVARATWPGPNATPHDWPQPLGYSNLQASAQAETKLIPRTVARLRVLYRVPLVKQGSDFILWNRPLIVGNSVFLGEAEVGTLWRKSATTGRTIWRSEMRALGVTYAHGILLVTSANGYQPTSFPVAIDAASGARLWAGPATTNPNTPISIQGARAFWSGYEEVHGISLRSGRRVLAATIRTESQGSTPTLSRGLVCVAFTNIVVAFDQATGRQVWQRRVPSEQGNAGYRSLPADNDGHLYVDAINDRVRELDLATGRINWVSATTYWSYTGLALSRDTLVLTDYYDGTTIVALDKADGRERWRFAQGDHGGATPNGIVALGGGVMYLWALRLPGGYYRYSLMALDLATGALLAEVPIAGSPHTAISISAGRLFACLEDELICLGLS